MAGYGYSGARTSKAVLDKYMGLSWEGDGRQATYVWVDGSGEWLRAKSRTLSGLPPKPAPADFPLWNFDGSSTGQAQTRNSDTYLQPVAVFKDPLRAPPVPGQAPNYLVLCETLDSELKPTASNKRRACAEAAAAVADEKPWFGVEQEYLILNADLAPLGWPKGGFPQPQGPYYCGVGGGRALGRDLVEAHYRACLHAGISIAGENAEVTPAQWEFQVGIVEGVAVGDHLWMARFLLHRIAEEMNVAVTFHPKPVLGNWNGAGLHTNFSTVGTRSTGGLDLMKEICEQRLRPLHTQHVAAYDVGGTNRLRLTGLHETSDPFKFSWGIADRSASIRISRDVARQGQGYLEDRRPPSNADPYVIAHALLTATFPTRTPQPPAPANQ